MKRLLILLLMSLSALAQQTMTTGTTMTSGTSMGGGTTATPPTLVSIGVNPGTASIATGGTQGYTASGNYSDGSSLDVTSACTWASSNTAVASIKTAGNPEIFGGNGSGTATITCTIGSIVGTGTLTVSAVVIINPSALPNWIIGTANSATFTASGGSPPYTFSESGTLPTGLSFASPTLSGTAAGGTQGNYPVTISVTDSASPPNTASQNYVLQVFIAGSNVAQVAKLPQFWPNPHECDPPGGVYDVTKTIKASGGDYTNSTTQFTQALRDWCGDGTNPASDQWEHLVVDAGLDIADVAPHVISYCAKVVALHNVGGGITAISRASNVVTATTTSQTGDDVGSTVTVAGVTDSSFNGTFTVTAMPAQNQLQWAQTAANASSSGGNVQDHRPTKCLVIESSTPLTPGQTACNGMTNPHTGTRNYQCASGTDKAKMYKLHNANTTSKVITAAGTTGPTGTVDAYNNGPNHMVLRDFEMYSTGGNINSNNFLLYMDNDQATFPNESQQPHDVGIERFYIHGDFPDVGPFTSSHGYQTAIKWGAANSWIQWGYADQIAGLGIESHILGLGNAQQTQVVGNWFEGASVDVFVGGGLPDLVGPNNQSGFMPCDLIFRRNKLTKSAAWMNGSTLVGQGFNLKGEFELKTGCRTLQNGNDYENSTVFSGIGSQQGQFISINIRNNQAQWYWNDLTDVTVTNEVLHHGASGIAVAGRSDDPAGVSLGGARYNFNNILLYGVSNPSVYGTTSYMFRDGGGGNIWTSCTATRTSNVAAVVCPNHIITVGTKNFTFTQTDTQVGDPVYVYNCADSTFNTSPAGSALAPLAIAPTTLNNDGLNDANGNPHGLTMYYPNTGSNVSTPVTGCVYATVQGYPTDVILNHFTAIASGSSLRWTGLSESRTNTPYMVRHQYKNILLGVNGSWGGSSWDGYAEGNTGMSAEWDANTLEFHHQDIIGRGGSASKYYGYPSPGAAPCVDGTNPACNLWFDAVPYCSASTVAGSAQTCPGFAGMMSTTTFNGDSANPFTDYALDSSSPYKAGQSRQADDSTDNGVHMTPLSTAESETTYSGCSGNCGPIGPFPD